MPRRATYVVLFFVAVMILAVWLLWSPGGDAGSGGTPTWGRGELKVSERAYYMNSINTPLVTARYPRWAGSPAGRESPDSVYLVIDVGKKQMWIESDGRVMQEHGTDLPPSMDWKLYRSTPNGPVEMASSSRFRLPQDPMKRRYFLEDVWLVGTRGKQETMYFQLGSPIGSCRYHKGSWSPQSIRWPASMRQLPQDGSYESIVVSDADYEKAKANFKAGGGCGRAGGID